MSLHRFKKKTAFRLNPCQTVHFPWPLSCLMDVHADVCLRCTLVQLSLIHPQSMVDVYKCIWKASTQTNLNKIRNPLLISCQMTQNGSISTISTCRNSCLHSETRFEKEPVIGQRNFASIHVWSDAEWHGVGSCSAHEGTSRLEANLWLSKRRSMEVSDTKTQINISTVSLSLFSYILHVFDNTSQKHNNRKTTKRTQRC